MKSRGVAALTILTVSLLMVCRGERAHEIEHPATAVWQSTGIEIPDDSTVLIEAVGTISHNGHVHVDADGTEHEDWNQKPNIHEGMNHCAQVARNGAGGQPLLIRVSRETEVYRGDFLVVGLNDSYPENNVGSLNVTATIRK